MRKRVVLGCLLVLMLTPISFAVAEPTGVKNVNVISSTTFDMEWKKTFGGLDEELARSVVQTIDGGLL